MKSLLEKVSELEQRVVFLEDELRKLKFVQSQENSEEIILHQMTKEAAFREGGFNYVGEFTSSDAHSPVQAFESTVKRHSMDLSRDSDHLQGIPRRQKTKYSESIVGKYIAGVLASLLIFIGAASFVSMIWNDIGNLMKFLIVLGAGSLLCAGGYYLLMKTNEKRTPNSTIGSIVFSTGSGLVYLSFMAGSVAFGLFNHLISMALCLTWSIALLLFYRYTNRFLSVVIAFLGTSVNLILSMSYTLYQGDYILLLLMVSVVAAVGLYITAKNRDGGFEGSVLMAGALYIVFIGSLNEMQSWSTQFELPALLALMMLKNLLYYKTEKSEGRETSKLIFSSISFRYDVMPFLMLAGFVLTLYNAGFLRKMDYFLSQTVLFVVFTLQFVISAVYFRKMSKVLNLLYALMIYMAVHRITEHFLDAGSGVFMIFLLFVVSDKLWKASYSKFFLLCILLFDTVSLSMNVGENQYLFGLINIVIVMYLAKKEIFERRVLFENSMLLSFLFNSYTVAVGIVKWFPDISHIEAFDYRFAVFHVLAVALLISAIQFKMIMVRKKVQTLQEEELIGGFSEDDSREFSVRSKFTKSIFSEYHLNFDYLGVHLYLLFLYFSGLNMMQEVFFTGVKFSITLSTLFVVLMQSYMITKIEGKISNLSGGWMVAKYLLYTWAVMRAFLKLPADSLAYSIAGLAIAVVSIYMGFRVKVSSVRLFGLSLTVLMVAKYIFVDLSAENSITRVAAFVVGGVLCFVVSVIYNKLSKDNT